MNTVALKTIERLIVHGNSVVGSKEHQIQKTLNSLNIPKRKHFINPSTSKDNKKYVYIYTASNVEKKELIKKINFFNSSDEE